MKISRYHTGEITLVNGFGMESVMAVHFILGGSGCGKTYYINHLAVKMAQKEPDREFIVLVPEQFTMQTQKELVSITDKKGIMNIEVQSFVRLAYRIFGETGAGNVPVLDDMGKTMVLRKVLENEKDRLQYFGKCIGKRGYIEEIKSFLSELLQYDISEEQLGQMIAVSGKKILLQQKLQDMAVIYKAFRDYLKEHYITSEEVLSVLCDTVPESKLLEEAVIFLDGFTGFTPIQYRLMEQLMRRCREMYFSITIDPREELVRIGPPHRLFYMSRKTLFRLRKLAASCHVEICPEIWTGKETDKTRFAEAPGLHFLEQNLFRYPVRTCEEEPEDISIHVLKQPEQEVEFVVESILALRQSEGVHYRDIAVVTGDMEVYGVLAREIFERAGLPCFIDQKKSILLHPMVQMLRAVADVLADYAYADILRYLRGRYCPIASEDVDLLDNFLLASGIRGHKLWQQEWNCSRTLHLQPDSEEAEETERRLNDIRVRALHIWEPLYLSIGEGKHSVKEYAEAFCRFLEEQEFFRRLQEDAQKFREQGMMTYAKEYEQIYGIVLDVFERLAELLGEEEMNLKEFREILETGLSEARVGLIPPGVDQIVVGDISRTRLSRVKYLFFLGTNDCNIPKAGGGGGILSESERSFLLESEFELAPDSRSEIFTEQFYLYLNLTKPEKHLYVCYCETGNDGRARNPAYVVERLRKMFPKLKPGIEALRQDAAHLLGEDMGKRFLIRGMRNRDYSDDRWKELYRSYCCVPERREEAFRLLQAAYYREQESSISKAAAKALYHSVIYGSASRFEKYAACPFAYFMQYGLRLQERDERQVEFFDIGNIVHEALELYTKHLLEEKRRWQDLEISEQHILANECLNQVVEEYKNGILYDTQRDTHMIDRLRRVLHRTIWAVTKQMEQGEFETIACELSFRNVYGPVNLTGRVDRVDAVVGEKQDYITIVDYKTGQKDISLSDLYYGLQMQLIIYLKAILDNRREKKMTVPAGVLYYHVEDPVLSGKPEEEKREKALLEALKLKGLLNEDNPVLSCIDRDFQTGSEELPPSVTSCIAPFATDKNGMLKKTSSTVTGSDFTVLMEFAGQQMQQMGEQILEGRTRAEPYRRQDAGGESACDYCPYHGICRFDTRIPGNRYRPIKKLTNDEVLQRITGGTGGTDADGAGQ